MLKLSYCGGGGGGGGVQSHFSVQPNYSVEIGLGCRWGWDNIPLSVLFFLVSR